MRRLPYRPFVLGAIVGGVPLTLTTTAFAQQTVQAPGSDQGTTPAAPGANGPAGGAPAPGTGQTTGTTTTIINPYMPSNQTGYTGPIGGGNATESSARTVTGDQSDSFDLGQGGAGAVSVHGDPNGNYIVGGPRNGMIEGQIPGQHIVRRGDTLSGICDLYFHNPYQWPRIWSYNPQIQNPHWIYPGDVVRLRQGGGPAYTSGGPQPPAGGNFAERRRQVPPDTVFLRDEGYIEDKSDQDWGEITGSPEDKMFLTEGDDIYVHVGGTRDVKLGQELTVFRPVRHVGQGNVIELLGTMRVNEWNGEERVARGTLTESLDVIERGARVGPIGRRYQVVPPVRNEKDVTAHVVASVHPHNFFGQNQVVFIDKGAKDGLRPGNRLFIIRRGDAWRRSLATPGAGTRISPESENMPDMEKTPGSRDEAHYPDEVIGELRVLEARPDSATCLVTQSKSEIERDDAAVARRGY